MDEGIHKVWLGSDVTIGMAAHGHAEITEKALQSLFLSAEGTFELILVNDCSPDNTLSLFLETRKRYPRTKILSFDRNLEYTGSLNAILSHAAGKWVLFISNDILVTPAYLREIFKVAKLSDDFGIVRGVSNMADTGLSMHNVTVEEAMHDSTDLFQFAEKIATQFGGQYLLDSFLIGDAFLVSRSVLDKVGFLDPLFYGYFADHDFGIRARIAGYKIVLARGAFALHVQNALCIPEGEEKRQRLHRRWMKIGENWARFKLKYGVPVDETFPSHNLSLVPWDELSSSATFDISRHYFDKGNYERYFV